MFFQNVLESLQQSEQQRWELAVKGVPTPIIGNRAGQCIVKTDPPPFPWTIAPHLCRDLATLPISPELHQQIIPTTQGDHGSGGYHENLLGWLPSLEPEEVGPSPVPVPVDVDTKASSTRELEMPQLTVGLRPPWGVDETTTKDPKEKVEAMTKVEVKGKVDEKVTAKAEAEADRIRDRATSLMWNSFQDGHLDIHLVELRDQLEVEAKGCLVEIRDQKAVTKPRKPSVKPEKNQAIFRNQTSWSTPCGVAEGPRLATLCGPLEQHQQKDPNSSLSNTVAKPQQQTSSSKDEAHSTVAKPQQQTASSKEEAPKLPPLGHQKFTKDQEQGCNSKDQKGAKDQEQKTSKGTTTPVLPKIAHKT